VRRTPVERVRLPRAARAVVTCAVLGGLAALGVASYLLSRRGLPDGRQLAVALVLVALIVVSWLRPLIIFVRRESEAIHLDEAFLVVMLLVLSPSIAVLGFGAATLVAQGILRRPLVKSSFNAGQVMLSAGAAAAVYAQVAAHRPTPVPIDLLAAVLAASAFFVVNNASVACILAATGEQWRQSLLDGMDVRLLLVGGGVVVALPAALVVAAYPWALVVAVLPLFIFRQVLAGHFEARHDRSRLNGLFDATLDIYQTMGKEEVTDELLAAARTLLRCSDATVCEEPTGNDGLVAQLASVQGAATWLEVTGRSRTEPFDDSDRALLDALAAVGGGALRNATLYQEGRFQRERLAAITSSLGEGVCAVNRTGQLTFMNPAASSMLGWDALSELGDASLLPNLETGPVAPSFVLAPAMRAIAAGETVTSEDSRFLRRDGTSLDVAFTASPIESDEGTPIGAVLVFRDVRDQKEMEQQLTRHAFHDALTSLPNRRLFLDHLDHALRRAERSSERHAVLFADVDRFKIVNDSLGHHAGDSMLVAITDRLKEAMRPGDMLARMGGDEFAVLLEAVTSPEDAVEAAQRILDNLRVPLSLPDGHDVVASLSIGIALSAPGKTRDDLLHDADVAMYRAKGVHGGDRYELFDVEAMGTRSAERLDLELALRQALERDQLEVYYQPLVRISDRTIVGAEALVRWNHPERGVLGPAQFISLAEDTGLILPLGRLVLEQACRQAKRWREVHDVSLSIGVNLSARQFQQPGLAEEIEEIISLVGVDPAQLCLEITESLAMADVARTSEILTQLKALGVRVAIDDFGTGYSALGYLASFPIDVVKIDRSFVDGIDVDPVKSAIVSAVFNLSQALGCTTVVEGIETTAELEHLRSLGCTVAQGFLFARPQPARMLGRLLGKARTDDGRRRGALAVARN
jgi:diguanylate cyclase (GGDEF)-like protein/PAS domain S-box-containing protein